MAHSINAYPNVRLIYSDEDKIDENGIRSGPYFKSEWNIDLFYSQNMFSHLGVYYTELVREVGGFRQGVEGSQDYDLALRCIERISTNQIHHIPRVLYHWRMHAQSTAMTCDAKPYAVVSGEKALSDHFSRRGVGAQVAFVGHGYRVRYLLPNSLPLVSVLIMAGNGEEKLRKCIENVDKFSTYTNYEIVILVAGGVDARERGYVNILEAERRVRICCDIESPGYSRLNNAAVKIARGDFVVLMNSGLNIMSADWLSELVSYAIQPGVGVVGARLWSADGRLKHGGYILGIGEQGVVTKSQLHISRHQHGYFGRAGLAQSYSAVSSDCFIVRKSIYEKVGGLDESNLCTKFIDVDFCLRVSEFGYRNVWTPFAELCYSVDDTNSLEIPVDSMAQVLKDVDYMKQRWARLLSEDPFYNPNLSLDKGDFCLAWPPRVAGVEL